MTRAAGLMGGHKVDDDCLSPWTVWMPYETSIEHLWCTVHLPPTQLHYRERTVARGCWMVLESERKRWSDAMKLMVWRKTCVIVLRGSLFILKKILHFRRPISRFDQSVSVYQSSINSVCRILGNMYPDLHNLFPLPFFLYRDLRTHSGAPIPTLWHTGIFETKLFTGMRFGKWSPWCKLASQTGYVDYPFRDLGIQIAVVNLV